MQFKCRYGNTAFYVWMDLSFQITCLSKTKLMIVKYDVELDQYKTCKSPGQQDSCWTQHCYFKKLYCNEY